MKEYIREAKNKKIIRKTISKEILRFTFSLIFCILLSMSRVLKTFKNREFLFLFFIILFGLFLRIWSFYPLFYFAIDEEKASFIVKGIIDFKHFPSVGHPSSIGFRLGPLLYYLISPIYKIFGPHPVNLGYLSILASIFSMILIYKIGSRVNKYTGWFSLIIYTFSYLTVIYDRRGWQVSFHSIIALVILFSLIKIKNGNQKYFYLLTFVLIAASQFEVATLLFIPLVLLIFTYFKVGIKPKILLFSIGLFLLSQASLLFFDLRHDFINSKYLINYFLPKSEARIKPNIPLKGEREVYLAHNLIPSTLARTIFSNSDGNLAIQYANCPQYLYSKQSRVHTVSKLLIILILIFFSYTVFATRKNNDDPQFILRIILIYLSIIFIGISFYTYFFHGEMAEYYLLSIFAYFFIIIGYFLSRLSTGKLYFIPVILLSIFIIDNTFKLIKSYNPYGLEKKEDAVNYSISIVKTQPFILDSFQTCWYSGGFRYLYTLYGKEPIKSYMDQYMSEYYAIEEKVKPVYQVAILTPELIGDNPKGYEAYRNEIKNNSDYQNKFGAIEVYIRKLD